jgi:microsomal dipeptidase-like Zn-dependent dipeptidase
MWWVVEALSHGMAAGYSRIEQALAREGKDTIAQELRSAFYVDASNLNVSCMEQALAFVAACSTLPTMSVDGE